MKIKIAIALALSTLLAADGFYGGLSWLYLQPVATDGDLEYGSRIPLTVVPANLTARLLEVRPDYRSALGADFGYRFDCQRVDARYHYFQGAGRASAEIDRPLVVMQNFLGGNYSRSFGASSYQIHDLALRYGLDARLDCLALHPYLGLGYGWIGRKLGVKYDDLLREPPSGFASAELRSHFWGVGPLVGIEAAHPICGALKIHAGVEAGVLIGETRSSIDSSAVFGGEALSFADHNSSSRVATALKSDVALSYGWKCFEVRAGYRADIYIHPINRINPFLGYVVNDNTHPVSRSGSVGLHGPYVSILFSEACPPTIPLAASLDDTALTFRFVNHWLEPTATEGDTIYAVEESATESRSRRTRGHTVWAGSYHLGYEFGCSNDLELSYLHYIEKDQARLQAPQIRSVNSSGPAFTRFTEADSRVRYGLDQVQLAVGKSWCWLRGSVGLRYLELTRRFRRSYLGGTEDGIPDQVTETKFPVLRSRFWGTGPTFGFQPRWNLCSGLSLRGELDLTVAIGTMKASLDQPNFGTLGASSNTVNTPATVTMVPVLDLKGGIHYERQFNCLGVELGAGYEFSEYYRGINLLFPVFLTGLGQNNNNLILSGPYLELGASWSF